MNDQGRPTRAEPPRAKRETFTGNRGLAIEEPLLFEIGRAGDHRRRRRRAAAKCDRLGKHRRKAPIDLPALSEPEAMRHYVRLSQKNYAHRPRHLSARLVHDEAQSAPERSRGAAVRAFADIHPLQPMSTVPGALELIDELGRWLLEITGMHSVAMTPEGRRARRALRHDGDQGSADRARRDARARCWCRNRRTAPIRRRRPCSAIPSSRCRRDADGTVRAADVQEEARGEPGRDRRDHADQPEHLRHLRAGGGGDRRGRARGRRLLLLRRRQPERHHGQGEARARSASTPCTSTCTRHSPRRTAAAVRGRGRWCFRRRSRLSRRCRSSSSTSRRPRTSVLASPSMKAELPARGRSRFGRMSAFHGQMGMFVRAYAWML